MEGGKSVSQSVTFVQTRWRETGVSAFLLMESSCCCSGDPFCLCLLTYLERETALASLIYISAQDEEDASKRNEIFIQVSSAAMMLSLSLSLALY